MSEKNNKNNLRFEAKIVISDDIQKKLVFDKQQFLSANLINPKSNSDFYNCIIINTYNYFAESKENSLTYELLKKNILTYTNDFVKDNEIKLDCDQELKANLSIDAFAKSLTRTVLKNQVLTKNTINNKSKTIYIQGTNETNPTYLSIKNIYKDYGKMTDVLRDIILEYLALPSYIREQILFAKTYEKIQKAFKNKHECIITTIKNKQYNIRIVDIQIDKEGYRNYILAEAKETYSDKDYKLRAFKLSTIDIVSELSNIMVEISKQSIDDVHYRSVFNGPAHISSVPNRYDIKFLDVELFYDLYKDRPNFEELNHKDEFRFSAGDFQMLNYLKPFGNKIQIIGTSPAEKQLADKLIDFYRESFDALNTTIFQKDE